MCSKNYLNNSQKKNYWYNIDEKKFYCFSIKANINDCHYIKGRKVFFQ